LASLLVPSSGFAAGFALLAFPVPVFDLVLERIGGLAAVIVEARGVFVCLVAVALPIAVFGTGARAVWPLLRVLLAARAGVAAAAVASADVIRFEVFFPPLVETAAPGPSITVDAAARAFAAVPVR
jgi:hypothetical protein